MTARSFLVALLFAATLPALSQDAPAFRFDPPLNFPEGTRPFLADLNGDGSMDQLRYAFASQQLMLSKGMAWGHFDLPRPVPDCAGCSPAFEMLPIQADVDPGMEILFSTGSAVHILDLTPTGGGARHLIYPTGAGSTQPVVVDLDFDGLDEFAVFTTTGQLDAEQRETYRLSIFANHWPAGFYRRDGAAFSTSERSPFPDTNTFDIDGDGLVDLLAGPCPGPCLLRQEPNGTIVPTMLADQTDDTLRSSDQFYADIDEDGDVDRARVTGPLDHSVDLQVTPGVFAPAFALPQYGAGYAHGAVLGDIDGNGLVDVVYNSDGRLMGAMHTVPGTFEHVFMGGGYLERPWLVDADRDGCVDTIDASGQWFRGRHCQRADIAVAASGETGRFTATVSHVEGERVFTGERLRVSFVPAIADDVLDGKINRVRIVAPAGCIEAEARAPRRIFDCGIGALAAGASITLDFAVDAALPSRPFAALHGIAFRFGGQADAGPANDRAYAEIPHHAVPLATPAPPAARPTPLPKPAPDPAATPRRAGRSLQESVR